MERTSIQSETMPWINRETAAPMIPITAQAGTRQKVEFFLDGGDRCFVEVEQGGHPGEENGYEENDRDQRTARH